jgi:hypothetical protein
MSTEVVKRLEVFGMPSDYQLDMLGSKEANVLNGVVSVRRYRVTVEEIEEPVEVLRERLVQLNGQRLHMDSKAAIERAAVVLGVTL